MAYSPRRSRFLRGDRTLYRQCDGHRVIDVKPVTVVEDSEARLVLWLPLGTPTKQPVLLNHEPGSPRRWHDGQWRLVDSTWRLGESLILVHPDELRATWLTWLPEGTFAGWYVNLQSELRHTRLGFDLTDYQLDIVVRPDRTWQWKDEDEYAIAVEAGTISRELAEKVREEASRTVRAIETNGRPFSEGWENWRPQESLPRPMLTPGWDDMSMYDGSGMMGGHHDESTGVPVGQV